MESLFIIFKIGSAGAGAIVTTADDMGVDGALTVNNGGATTWNISDDNILMSGDMDLVNLDYIYDY